MLNDKYEMEVGPDSFVAVRDRATGRLVAYSCMRADYEQSLEEFTRDYFPEPRATPVGS